jgi:hypothetical protein
MLFLFYTLYIYIYIYIYIYNMPRYIIEAIYLEKKYRRIWNLEQVSIYFVSANHFSGV